MAEKALLVADMLNDFVREGAPLRVPDTKRAIPTIKREIQRARKDGIPVIYLCDAHDPDDKEFSRYGWPAHAVKGTEGAQVIKELKPEAGDIIVEKKTYSGFYRTSLDKILKELGVNTVRLTGCVTHICVLFTVSEAALRGYSVEVVTGGVAGLAKQDHTAALRIMKNVLGAKLV